MNFIGKIFVVLIFIMSVLWMGFAVAVYATHKSWRDYVMNETPAPGKPLGLLHQFNDLKQRRDELKKQMERLQAELDKEKTFQRQALAKLETEKEELAKELDQRQQELSQEVQERRDAVAALDAANKRLASQMAELQRLREEIRQVQDDRDQKMQEVIRLTDQLHQEKLKYEALESRYKQLAEDNAEMKRRLRLASLPVPPEAWVDEPLVEVEGFVTRVTPGGRVEVNLGSDDGLRKGGQLYVLRGGNFVAKIEVVETRPDQAVAKVIPGMQQSPIQPNDYVKSRLGSR